VSVLVTVREFESGVAAQVKHPFGLRVRETTVGRPCPNRTACAAAQRVGEREVEVACDEDEALRDRDEPDHRVVLTAMLRAGDFEDDVIGGHQIRREIPREVPVNQEA
jgi:hypothetical protein